MRVHVFLLLSCLGLMLTASEILAVTKKPTVTPTLFRQLKKSEDFISNKKYTEAGKVLNKALKQVKKGSYSEAVVLRNLASVYSLQSKYQQAISALLQCVSIKKLPVEQQQQALLNLGGLYLADEQYREAVATLKPLADAAKKPDPSLLIILGNAHAQLKQYQQALPLVEQAIKLTNKPNHDWFQLQLALNYKLQNYRKAASILNTLLSHYPDKAAYWEQLSGIYLQLKDYKKAVTIKNLAYQKGYVYKSEDLLTLVNLMLLIDAPYQAAFVLQRELDAGRVKSNSKNWQLLATAWIQAQEYSKAINSLSKAIKLTPQADLYLRLGHIHLELEQWQQGITALDQAVKLGGLKNPGNAYYLLGVSYYEAKDFVKSKSAFIKAKRYAESRRNAEQWLRQFSEQSS